MMKGSPSHWYNHSLLLTSDSFICRQDNHGRIKPPTMISSLVTVFFYMVILSLIEQICIHLFASLKFLHPILEDRENCITLARNLGVRAFSTFIIAFHGIQNRHLFSDLSSDFFKGTTAMKASAFEERLFTYHPSAHQCSLLFCSYQVINFIGSCIHREEWIHLIHHFVSVIMAWICMHPGNGHCYVIASSATEIPAFISSVYISFDHGGMIGYVPGLGQAFPRVRMVLLFLTGASFIFCRIFFWFFVAYHYLNDISRAMKCESKLCQSWRPYFPAYKIFTYLLISIQLYLLLCVLGYIPVVLKSVSWMR